MKGKWLALGMGVFLIGLGLGYTWHFKQVEPAMKEAVKVIQDLEVAVESLRQQRNAATGKAMMYEGLYKNAIAKRN